ncbi:MAG: methionine--tRNA ligase subunit beta, partial [Methanomicrobiales archaeon]|nr:methionine--tRNA ligase subunit beta [Methanomicrobiales archaeon]
INDQKFSKSRGYVVWTNEDYLDKGLPADYLRYYLLSYTSHTRELNFSWKVFQERVNNEVVGTLGNFVYRTLYFAHKFFETLPDTPVDEEILAHISHSMEEMENATRSYEFKSAVDAMMSLASYGNSYIQNQAPWQLIKTDRVSAERVIRNCYQIVHALALMMEPVMPDSAGRVWEMLGNTDRVSDHPIGEALDYPPSLTLPAPVPPFVKMEDERTQELEALLKKRVEEADRKAKEGDEVSIQEFGRLDIRVGRVVSATRIKGSKKLLVLKIDVGGEERQVVSGIADFYEAEELVGREVTVLLNLTPVKIFGIESRGMILAAGDQASLLVPFRTVEPGTKIR